MPIKARVQTQGSYSNVYLQMDGYGHYELTTLEVEQLIKDLRRTVDRVRSLNTSPRKLGDY